MLAWQPGVEAIAVKCDLCYFREDGPACVQTCPTKTLFIISDEVSNRLTKENVKWQWFLRLLFQDSSVF